MKAIDLTAQAQGLQVHLDDSPVYDFFAALYVVRHWAPVSGFEIGRSWVGAARDKLGDRLMEDAAFLLPRRGPSLGVLSLLEAVPGSSVGAFLRRLEHTSPPLVLEAMLGSAAVVRPVLPLLRRAIGGDSDAASAVVAAYPQEYDLAAVRSILSARPSVTKARLLRLLQVFYNRVYQHEQEKITPLLKRDVDARRKMLRAASAQEVVERATGGFVVTQDGGVPSVLLAPTFFFRPYNLITEYHGVRVFIYPVETGAGSEADPRQDAARLYKALGDETRLRILRMLAGREMYVQEIAKALGVSHVTAIHHLAVLRAAHLVQVVERENLRYYRLRPDAPAEAGRRLREYLKS